MKRALSIILAALLALGMFGALAETVPEETKGETLELEAVGAETKAGVGDEAGELDLLSLEGDSVSLNEAGQEDGAPEAAEANAKAIAIDKKHFPDAVFRGYVRENFDADGDGKLSADERFAVKEIHIDEMGVESLKGLEYFTNLRFLDCTNNRLTKLDVSKNTVLVQLICINNRLTNLNVTKNVALKHLNCPNNRLATLDVTKNSALEFLNCSNNKLTKLDVTKNTGLITLYCDFDRLTKLDITKNSRLEDLSCSNNQLTKLDVAKNKKLGYMNCRDNQLTKLDVTKNKGLGYLECAENQLTKLDVTKNKELVKLDCSGNKLTKLDVSKNTKLDMLFTYDSAIKTVDLKNCPRLRKALSKYRKKATKKYVKWLKEYDDGPVYGVYIDVSTTLTNGKKILYKGK